LTTRGRIPDDVISARKQLETGARDAAGEWISALRPWDLYFTLTYDQRRPRYTQAPSMWASRRHAQGWLDDVLIAFVRNVDSVASLEYQNNGWPHWHGLLSAGGVSPREFTKASELWFSKYGYCKFVQLGDLDRNRVSEYVAKYITKYTGDMLFYGLKGIKP
jgi:hypothetical protein